MTRYIFTAADSNYCLQAKVLLRSLVLTQVETTELIVFGSGWTHGAKDDLSSVAGGCVSVVVRDVDISLFSDIRLKSGFPLATAYNVLAPRYMVSDLDKLLYLDADMLVLDDLRPLWDNSSEYALSAVVDAHVAVVGSPSMWRPWREEGVHPMCPYLNTGTMFIEVEKWNNQSLTERTLDLLRKYELPCMDQDALNLVLRGEFQRLEPRFNSMPYHLLSLFRYSDLIDSQEEIESAILNPAVLHYHRSFFGKPWTVGTTHPAAHLWCSLADQVEPRWRRSLDMYNLLRNRAARIAKMTTTDPRAMSMSSLSLSEDVV